MDLTLPEIPGALLGYRRNGQPIYLAAGGAPEDEDDTTDDQTDDAAETDDDDTEDWKAKYEEAEAARKAQVRINKDIERRYKREAPKPAPTGQQQADDEPTEAEIRAAEAEVRLVSREVADEFGDAGRALLDSVKFCRKLNRLDVEDLDEYEDEARKLFAAELKNQPPPKKAPAKKVGADMSGGAGGKTRPKGIAAAIAARYSGGK